ncbi:MAG: hypothetical protein IJX88_00245 [Clostridia bacterium]|nr:hypothetical protein [Clostridia bacterium]
MKRLKKLCVLLLVLLTALFTLVGCGVPSNSVAAKEKLNKNSFTITETYRYIVEMDNCPVVVMKGTRMNGSETEKEIVVVYFGYNTDAKKFYKEYAEKYIFDFFPGHGKWAVEIKRKDNWVVYGEEEDIDDFFAITPGCPG